MPELQTVDAAVSRAKFDREIAAYRKLEAEYRRRGWLLLDASFPEVCVAFAATKVKPALLACAVVVDFTNYDLRPLSVRFVDPFTRDPLACKDLTFGMWRRPEIAGAPPPNIVAELIQQGAVQLTNLVQGNGPDDPPFLCLPGVREYHDNPAHTGDSWLLHRGGGEGSLAFILDKIWHYGTNLIEQVPVVAEIQVQFLNPRVQGAIPPAFHAIPT